MTRLSDTDRTARKAHRCSVCRNTIEPGTKYNDFRGVADGQAYTFRSHLACQALGWAYIRRDGYESEYDDEDVWELLVNSTLDEVMAFPEVQVLDAAEQERVKAFWAQSHAERLREEDDHG